MQPNKASNVKQVGLSPDEAANVKEANVTQQGSGCQGSRLRPNKAANAKEADSASTVLPWARGPVVSTAPFLRARPYRTIPYLTPYHGQPLPTPITVPVPIRDLYTIEGGLALGLA